MSEIIKSITRTYDEFLTQLLGKHGYTIEQLMKTAEKNRCIVQGNRKHYFIDGKYVFSVIETLKYIQCDQTHQYNLTLDAYHDESMVDYSINEVECD
jgi:hypothetical protein